MAAAGVALQALSRKGSLSGSFAAFAISVIVAVGPWLFTVITVAGINMATVSHTGLHAFAEMRIVLIYNFSISLLLSGPVALVTTRFLADGLYARNMSKAAGALFAALAIALATQAPVACWLYLDVANLSPQMQLISIMSYLIVACLWVVAVFLSALKDYLTVTIAFAAGLLSAFGLSLALSSFGAEGLLGGFSAGLALTLFALMARIFAEYPTRLTSPWALLGYFRKYPELALSGLICNAGIWVDKWIMWLSPHAVRPETNLASYPAYDGAMFAAQLTMMPAIALFVYTVETRFFISYRTFYRTIERHGTLSRIEAAHADIMHTLMRSAQALGGLQLTLALCVIALSPTMLGLLDLHASQLGIFRLGAVGAAFHAIFLFLTIVLAYFDLRRQVLLVHCLFLSLNTAGTLLTLWLGEAWFGYGYVMACIGTSAVAAIATIGAIRHLPYLTFVGNNPALKGA